MSTTVMEQAVDHPPSSRGDPGRLDLSRIAQDLQIRKVQVEAVVQLLDEGNTIPFITRYRKERTGGLDEEVLRTIQERVGLLRQLAERKQTILRSIEGQGKLTDELRAAILAADNPKRLEDLYLPYKPKKRSLAMAAREKGLEKLAMLIWEADPLVANLNDLLPTLINPEQQLNTTDDILLGAQHILAELIAESADVRAIVRAVLWDTGKLCTAKSEKLAEGQGLEYKDYFSFQEPIRQIPPHRILAINRGEKDNALTVKLEWDAATGRRVALERLPLPHPSDAAALRAESSKPSGRAASDTEDAAALRAESSKPSGRAASDTQEPAPAAPETLPSPEVVAPVATAEAPQAMDGPSSPVAPAEQPIPAEAPREQPPAEHHRDRPHQGRRAHQPPPNRMEDLQKHPHREFIERCTDDALARLLVPSLEREIRRELTHKAENHAVVVFARNLRSKLLAAPLRGKRVLAIDPAFRTGCKVAALDETGNLLADAVVFPHPPQNKKAEAKAKLEEMVRRHQIHVIALGNGTACRETEELVSELIADLEARRNNPNPTPPADEPTPPQPPISSEPASDTRVEPTVADAVPNVVVDTAAPAPVIAEAAAPALAPVEPIVIAPAAVVDTPIPTPSGSDASPPLVAPVEDAAPPAVEAAAPVVVAPEPPPPPPAPLPEALPDLAYVIVNEAGASVYSASPVGREEFPNFDATLRGTISIGRRLQDPLSELVKIDPQHVGVGLYQHDVNPKHLRESLDAVIESCVNTVGVDLNTASVPLLRHVSGLNALVARELVDYRKNNGPFRRREQLLEVPGIGEVRFVQAAGFLKIGGGDNPLDGTWIHPESYGVARQLLHDLGYEAAQLSEKERVAELQEKLKSLTPEEVANRLQVGVPTLKDIIEALSRPGRDPREDLPPPVFKKGILKLEDLQPGMELKGTVLNVVDFGAFIDIGLKDSGLVHISQMANRYVKSPYDVVAVGDVVTVWVLAVDGQRHRVSLTMIQPGSERRPPERRPPPRREREHREREGGLGPFQGHGPIARPGQPAHPQGARPPQGGGGGPREGRQGGERGERGELGGGERSGLPARGRSRSSLPPRGTSRLGTGGKPHQQRRPEDQTQQQAAQTPPGEGQPGTAGQGGKQQAPPPPRKKRTPPTPRLSPAALSGKEPLSTFGELAALFEQRNKPEEPTPAPPPPPPEAPQETPPSDGTPPA